MKPRRWTENDLRAAVPRAKSIREVLERLLLVPAGGNYSTVKRHFKDLALDTSHLKGRIWNKGLRSLRILVVLSREYCRKVSTTRVSSSRGDYSQPV